MKFNENGLGLALAGALGSAYTVMVLANTLLPGSAFNMAHAVIHLHGASFTVASYISGLIQTVIGAYIIGFFLGYVYNNLDKA